MARLTATISIINPLAGVSYALPVAQVGYILMAAQADTDASGRYQIVFDLVSVSDQAILQTGKGLNTQQNWSDKADLQMGKGLVDSQSITEAKALSVDRFFQSPNTINHAYFLEAYASLDYSEDPFPETVFIVDIPSLSVTRPLNDSQSTSDYKNWQFNKTLRDAFGINDTAVIGDGIAFTSSKFAANVFTPSDRYISELSKALTDATTASDSGLLVLQGYCDQSYLAADYVGISRSF